MSDAKKLSEIADGAVVALYYTLKDPSGEVLDSNRKGGDPLVYLHGAGNIVPGLENALVGKAKDEFVEVVVPPEEGYGPRSDEAIQTVPLSAFPDGAEVVPGARFIAQNQAGQQIPTEIVSIEGDEVTVDHNHPLAGQALHFEVTVAGIREATDEEKQHGHVHGPGGHQH